MGLYRSIQEPVDSVVFISTLKYLPAMNFCLVITVLLITVAPRSKA